MLLFDCSRIEYLNNMVYSSKMLVSSSEYYNEKILGTDLFQKNFH